MTTFHPPQTLADDPQKTRSSANPFSLADELADGGGWTELSVHKVNKINNLASANLLADEWRMNSGTPSSANPPPPYKVADAGGWRVADRKTRSNRSIQTDPKVALEQLEVSQC